MAVAFDAKATANSHTTGTTVVTLSNANMTVGSGSNRALLCVVSWEGVAAPTGISAKWDTAGTNQTMAQIGSTISNGNFRVALFGLLAPTSGNKNFTLSWTNTCSCYLDLIAFTGVDQTSNAVAFPHFNSATATSTGPATVNITSASGNYTLATFVADAAGDLTTLNQTVMYGPDIADSNCSGAANYAVGAASNTHNCTVSASTAWAVCGVDVLASGAAAAQTPYNPWPQLGPVVAQCLPWLIYLAAGIMARGGLGGLPGFGEARARRVRRLFRYDVSRSGLRARAGLRRLAGAPGQAENRSPRRSSRIGRGTIGFSP